QLVLALANRELRTLGPRDKLVRRRSALRQHRPNISPVNRSIRRCRRPAQLANGRKNIGRHHNLVDHFTRGNMPWPVDEPWHMHPTIEGAELEPAKWRVLS